MTETGGATLGLKDCIGTISILTFSLALLAGCNDFKSTESDESSVSRDLPKRGANYIFYSCVNKAQKNRNTVEYQVDYFNNTKFEITLRHNEEGGNSGVTSLRKVNTDYWESKGSFAVKMKQNNDRKVLEVFDVARGITSNATQSMCISKDQFPGCPQYSLEIQGKCLWTGQAKVSVVGNMVIQAFGSGLVTTIAKSILSLGRSVVVGTAGDHLLISSGSSDAIILPKAGFEYVSSKAIEKQLYTVDDEIINILKKMSEEKGNSIYNQAISVDDILSQATKLSQSAERMGIKNRFTLGTAKKYTLDSGNEISLFRDAANEKHFVVIGEGSRVQPPVWDPKVKLIFRTHPLAEESTLKMLINLFGDGKDTVRAASYGDMNYIAGLGQSSSFIIPTLPENEISVFFPSN